MILGLEPVEALRYLEYLSPDGVLITAADPVTNVTDYPRIDEVHEVVSRIGGHLVEAFRLAKESGSPRAANVVMVGAASVYLPLAVVSLEAAVTEAFAAKGDRVIGINLAAFRAGRAILTPAAS
jgi:Pyruvate/2-oxoacid:ferredoxin oxidoreductase gamma subunit